MRRDPDIITITASAFANPIIAPLVWWVSSCGYDVMLVGTREEYEAAAALRKVVEKSYGDMYLGEYPGDAFLERIRKRDIMA